MQMHARYPNLSEYVDSNLPPDNGRDLALAGPSTQEIRRHAGSEEQTRPLVASTFWQSYVNSDAFERELTRYGMSLTVLGEGEPLIVTHGFQRYTLLLPSHQISGPISFVAEVTAAELHEGWYRANTRRLFARDLPPYIPNPIRIQEELGLTPQVAVEAYELQRFYVLIVPWMEEELTTVPCPACMVDTSGVCPSTAGAIVQDSVGRVGVTAAAHAVPVGSSVEVNSYPAYVVARADDAKYDCCFIHVPGVSWVGLCSPSYGPLKLAPRMNEPASFDRVGHGKVVTSVRAFNYELPYIDPHLQQTVRTDYVTSRGDSGAALLDNNNYILGFAHSRSAANASVSYSSWIWADAVFQRLGVTIY
jgi:hypothetical protein